MDAASINGTTLADSSANHNDGILVGFPQNPTAPGRFGEALVYPAAAAANVRVAQLGLDQASGGINSVSMWFRRSGNGTNDVLVLLPNAPRYDLWFHNDSDLCINTGRGDCWGVRNNTLLDRWVHVVALFVNGSTSQGSLYVDGKNGNAACLSGYSACTGVNGTAALPVELGGESDFPFHGMLDEVEIFNRALTASEVSTLYNGMACP
ncbi:MAG TPA: LamG domain-containing protein [Polyangiaceae bacterium]|nr:LamG domain-containing protein [Polyangiaceae bacterium]